LLERRGEDAGRIWALESCAAMSVHKGLALVGSYRGGGRLTVGWEFQQNLENDYVELLCELTS
jgi:hypothetical protein